MSEEKQFTITVDKVDRDIYIVPPTPRVTADASRVYNRAFKEALDGGAILRGVLDEKLRHEGMWSDEREADYTKLVKEIAALDYTLNSGTEDGKKVKLSRGKEAALELRKKRSELQNLIMDRNRYDEATAEASSDNAKFNFLLSACVMDSLTRKPVFVSYEDYLDKSDKELSYKVAEKFANYMYGLSEDFESTLTENKFLKRFNFCDEKGRLIDEDKNLIDSKGDRVDEEGYRLDKDGNRIDINGNPILPEEINVDTVEFEDDVKPKRKKSPKTEE